MRLVTHLRVLGLTSTLAALDAAFLYHALSSSIARGPSVLLLFAFEYLLLSSTIAATFVKYALYVNEARLGGRWDEKGEPPEGEGGGDALRACANSSAPAPQT